MNPIAMNPLFSNLSRNPVVYITRDLERALGIPLSTNGYFIISNATSFAKQKAKGQNNILLIESDKILDTHELMERAETKIMLENFKKPRILVFKNTPMIERLAKKKGLNLLNPPADLCATIEEKISQVEWLAESADFLPPHKITLARDIIWNGRPFILQFNRSHTGLGTRLIESRDELARLALKFPKRPTRVTDFIKGPMFTSNNIVSESDVIPGNISYQITGVKPFTDSQFATVGNDWSFASKILPRNGEAFAQYLKMVKKIGEKLRDCGWRGLFGIDFIMEQKTGRLYLIEINARQPASTAYESQLQHESMLECVPQLQSGANNNNKTISTFEAHLAALLSIPLENYTLKKIIDGAQIIVRNRADASIRQNKLELMAKELEAAGYGVIRYDNAKPGSDIIRIQCGSALMREHNKLNARGAAISAFAKNIWL